MIRDLSLSLRDLLTRGGRDLPELAAAQISFDRPADSFNPPQATVSLYLYDIRENLELRGNEPDITIVNGQASRRPAPRRIICSYLVTAWPGNVTGDELVLSEHRLLSQALVVMARNPTLPAPYLAGLLATQAPPPPIITARAEGLANPSEFWTAISNKLRPSLNVCVTISLQTAGAETATLVTSNEIVIRHDGVPASDFFHIAGHITTAASVAVAGARVSIAALGLSAVTGPDGSYVIGALARGNHILHVQNGAAGQNAAIVVPAVTVNAYDVKLT